MSATAGLRTPTGPPENCRSRGRGNSGREFAGAEQQEDRRQLLSTVRQRQHEADQAGVRPILARLGLVAMGCGRSSLPADLAMADARVKSVVRWLSWPDDAPRLGSAFARHGQEFADCCAVFAQVRSDSYLSRLRGEVAGARRARRVGEFYRLRWCSLQHPHPSPPRKRERGRTCEVTWGAPPMMLHQERGCPASDIAWQAISTLP